MFPSDAAICTCEYEFISVSKLSEFNNEYSSRWEQRPEKATQREDTHVSGNLLLNII